MNKQTIIISIILGILFNVNICKAYNNGTLWPGKTIRLEVNSSTGFFNPKWSASNPTVTVSGNGFHCDVKANAYFGGTCTITCSYEYHVGSTKYNNKQTWEYDCANNTFTLTPTRMNLGVGKTQPLKWSFGRPTYMTPTMQFTGYDTSIISVSPSGAITGKSEGTTTVYVSSNLGTNTASCVVNVSKNNVSVTPITISIPSNVALKTGETYQFLPEITSEDDDYTLTWSSEDETIASVDDNGKVTGIKSGKTTVTASINKGEIEAYCAVDVRNGNFELRATPAGGVVEKGTNVELTTGLKDAVIYYTLDGSNPMDNPTLYTEPICVETPLLINALAYHKDYGTSDMMTESYDVTTLKVSEISPSESDMDVDKSVTPTITFNEEIREGDLSLITMRNCKTAQTVKFECLTNGTELIIVPDEDLGACKYELSIPSYAVVNDMGEPNSDITCSFRVTSNEQYAHLDRYFRLMDNGSLYVWNYKFPEMDKDYSEEHLALDNVKKIFMPWSMDSHTYQPSQYYYIDTDDKLWGWGEISSGLYSGNLIGNGSEYDVSRPARILNNIKDFKNHQQHKAALSNNGYLYLWGKGSDGQIGDGYTFIDGSSARATPVCVLSDVKLFDIGQMHSIAVTNTGELLAWGRSYSIGKPLFDYEVPVSIDKNVIYACAGDRHNLYIKSDNSLWSFGASSCHDCLGTGSTKGDYVSPKKILTDVKMCYAGMYESLALKNNGDLYQWGYSGSYTNYSLGNTPAFVLQDVKDVQVAGRTTYVLKNDGTVWTRGINDEGQLGLGHTSTESEFYMDFHSPDIDNVERIWANAHVCYALKTDGSLWGWGYGLPYVRYSNVPVELRPGVKALESIAIAESDVRLKPNEKMLLHVALTPSSAAYENIEWTSGDEDIVKVSSRGIIQGVNEGETTVTVSAKTEAGFTFRATCNVVVAEATGISNVKMSSLQAWSSNGILHVSGLSTGERVSVYSAAGVLLDEFQAKNEVLRVPLPYKGICIVTTNKGKQAKVVISD